MPEMYLFESGTELTDGKLKRVDLDYAFGVSLKKKSQPHETYPYMDYGNEAVYAIAGNVPQPSYNGAILAAYSTSSFHEILSANDVSDGARFIIAKNNGEVIFDSMNALKKVEHDTFVNQTILRDEDGSVLHCEAIDHSELDFFCFYTISQERIIHAAFKNVPFIISAIVFFLLASLLISNISRSRISKRILAINSGIEGISKDPSIRILGSGRDDELDSITDTINEMAEKLSENMSTIVKYRIRHKTDELTMLQSHINPHFLYNTLEILRGRLEQLGDTQSADEILKTARILRNYADDRLFLPIAEEMSALRIYFDLYKSQRDSDPKMEFDVPSSILSYGIIRNLMQPLIENYILHGFDPERSDNRLRVQGRIAPDGYLILSVIDNGHGIPAGKLAIIHETLQSEEEMPVSQTGRRHYGLKNVDQRAKLFYGRECGLTISAMEKNGTRVDLRIRAMSCKQHEEHLHS